MEPHEEKSYEEMQADLYRKLCGQEYIQEIAMPGVRQPIQTEGSDNT